VGQAGRAHHQAEHQRQEVVALVVELRALLGRAVRVAAKRLAVARQAGQWPRAFAVLLQLLAPAQLGLLGVARQVGVFAAGGHDLAHIAVDRAQVADAFVQHQPVALQRQRHIHQLGLQRLDPRLVGLAHRQLLRRLQQGILQFGDLLQLAGIGHGRHRIAQLLVRQPGHGNQEGQQDHHVLRDLGPGHGAHATQERAQQHPAQAQHDADLELHPGQARGNQPHPVNLRHHIGERAQHRCQGRHRARPAATEAGLEEIRQGVQLHGAQVRGHQHGHQAKAPGPAQQIGQAARLAGGAAKALQVQRARQADEGGRAHPVGGGGHAVVDRGNAAAGDIVFVGIAGAPPDADGGIHHDRDKQEDGADPVARQAVLFGPGHQQQKADHGQAVQGDPAMDTPPVGTGTRGGGSGANAGGGGHGWYGQLARWHQVPRRCGSRTCP